METENGSAARNTGPNDRLGQKAWKYLYTESLADSRKLNRIALRDGLRDYTYGSMFHQWERYAAVFSALGMTEEKHARVGILGSTCAEVIFSVYALNMTGAEVSVMATYSALNPDRVLKTIREEKLTDFIFTDDIAQANLLNALLSKKDALGLRNVLYLHVPVGGPAIHPLLAAAQEYKYMATKGWYAPICMDTLLNVYGEKPVHYAPDGSGDTAFILHTSGTTSGVGKPVVLSDRAFNAAVAGFPQMEELAFLMRSPVSGLIVDLSNVYGLIDQVHLPLSVGGTVAIVPGNALNPDFYKAIPAYGITFLFTISAMFEHWMKLPASTVFDFSSLQGLVIGGSAISAKDKRRYYEFLQANGAGEIPLFNGYGISELGGACCLSTADLDDESIGYALPGVELRLYAEDTQVFLTAQDAPCTGVLYLSSDAVAGQTLDGKEILKTEILDGKPFVCTNDLVRLDSDGRITYLGRSNRYFLHEDGRKYESGRVETEIARQSGIESCGIVPVYQKVGHDNIPMLCVKTLGTDAVETVQKALEQVFCLEKTLELDQLPLRVLIAEELPRNANGKIDLYAINQGLVTGLRYEVEPVRFMKTVTGFKLVPLKEGASDMIESVFKDIAADMKTKLPFQQEENNSNDTEEEPTMKKKNANPFAAFSSMGQMGSQMMNMVKDQMNQFGQSPMFFGMPQNLNGYMNQMGQWFAGMNQMNQAGWKMMQQMNAQNWQRMQQMYTDNLKTINDFYKEYSAKAAAAAKAAQADAPAAAQEPETAEASEDAEA